MTELTRETLQALIDDDVDGLLVPEVKPEPVTHADILANRFEDINRFIDEHDRRPNLTNREDIGEFQLGHRLQAILENSEYMSALEHLDRHSLFDNAATEIGSIDDLLSSDNALLDDLLSDPAADEAGLFNHKHLPPPSREAPDKVARGQKCEDFELFEQSFIDCHTDLRSGRRQFKPFSNPSNIKQGFFYVQRGMLVYVDKIGELTKTEDGLNGRLRCIYENGTENDLLLRSLARSLYDSGKIVTEAADITTEMFGTPDHVKTGYVYVARTHNPDPALQAFPNLHKIGYTSQPVGKRIAGAANDPTFLHAKASLVTTYEMPAEYAQFIETALHQFFSEVRIDVQNDFGQSAIEWFDVPPEAIDQAINLIQSGQLANYHYDAATQAISL